MKMIVANLVELAPENQNLLGQLLLHTMNINGFKIDDVVIDFEAGTSD